MQREWESCMGVRTGLKLTGEGWAKQLNPRGHGFIVQGGKVFQRDGVRANVKIEF